MSVYLKRERVLVRLNERDGTGLVIQRMTRVSRVLTNVANIVQQNLYFGDLLN